MPGATATNIRKADLAEDLGRLLLRQFCALAPISKVDDFGIDTIATLLITDEHNALKELANKSFGIQFKAKSVRKIEFLKDYEYNWLLNLDFPYFLCSVDIQNSSMNIYTIHLITSLPSINEYCRGLIITLDKVENTIKPGILTLDLGDPIITLSISDISNKAILNNKRDILKDWILKEYENIKVRNIGLTKMGSWQTNEYSKFEMVNKIYADVENLKIYKESFDFLDSSLFELKLFSKDKYLLKAINTINTALKKKGIELFLINNSDGENFNKAIKK